MSTVPGCSDSFPTLAITYCYEIKGFLVQLIRDLASTSACPERVTQIQLVEFCLRCACLSPVTGISFTLLWCRISKEQSWLLEQYKNFSSIFLCLWVEHRLESCCAVFCLAHKKTWEWDFFSFHTLLLDTVYLFTQLSQREEISDFASRLLFFPSIPKII